MEKLLNDLKEKLRPEMDIQWDAVAIQVCRSICWERMGTSHQHGPAPVSGGSEEVRPVNANLISGNKL